MIAISGKIFLCCSGKVFIWKKKRSRLWPFYLPDILTMLLSHSKIFHKGSYCFKITTFSTYNEFPFPSQSKTFLIVAPLEKVPIDFSGRQFQENALRLVLVKSRTRLHGRGQNYSSFMPTESFHAELSRHVQSRYNPLP